MKTLLEWLEENRSTLKDGVYEVDHGGWVVHGNHLVSHSCKPTTDKYHVKDGVITLYTPKSLLSLEQWLMYNKFRNGVFETDGDGLVWANGDVYEPETHVQPTTDTYQIVDSVIILLTSDHVNSPSHYASGDIECIDAINASMTREAFLGYLKGNIQKYMWRYEKKINPLEDVKKARWYMNKLVDELDK